MRSIWLCFNNEGQIKYSWKKTGVHLMESAGCHMLNETIPATFYQIKFMKLSRALTEKRAHYYSRHRKISLLHYASLPVTVQVKIYLKTFNMEILP